MYDVKSLIIWILTPILEIILFIWNTLKHSRFVVLNALKETDPLLEVQSFCDYLDSSNSVVEDDEPGRQLPLERCTYGNLMELLRQQPGYALIYLHDIRDARCIDFYRSTLIQLGKDNFFATSECKLWACSLQSKEGKRVSQTLRARSFPFLAFIGFKHHRPIILLKLPGCEIGPVELKTKLLKVMNDNQMHLVEARLDKQERDETNLLRFLQDEEYNRSLAADREKARLKKEKQEQERIKIEEENQKLSKKNKLKEEMSSKLLSEPIESEEGIVKILVRFSNGVRIERRFNKKHSLQQLYAFTYLQEVCPDDFEVIATFPRRLIPCNPNSPDSNKTFEEFNFGKTETLFVNEL